MIGSGVRPHPLQVLQETFGFQAFRPGQEAVIEALLAGRSSLAVLPTGAGKSLCYQLPALMIDEGLTLVVSPLIALMKDQVDALRRRGVRCARLDSSLEAEDVFRIYDGLSDGSLRILYVAPERLANEGFLDRLRELPIALLAVDEAHCISQWGHNFRPDYLKLADLARELGVGRVLALTATATPQVSADILEAFEIAPQDHVQTGFHRPNLAIHVTPTQTAARKQVLLERLGRQEGSTIVYVTLQATAERVAGYLAARGVSARAYHAGLKSEERARIQEAFMRDAVQVVVATIAFGMGIDKPDIRAVYHYNLPKSLENYVQEIGRAGRDGHASRCEMLACADDRTTLTNFTFGDTPSREALVSLLRDVLLRGEYFSVSRYRLAADHDIRRLVVATALTYLELDGILEPTGPFYSDTQFKLLRPEDEILASLDRSYAAFCKRLFATAKLGRTWRSLRPAEAGMTLDVPRSRIVKALSYLEDRGDIHQKLSGLRHGYRLASRPNTEELADELTRRFRAREVGDVQRVDQVLQLAAHGSCLPRHFLEHFGEALPEDCGQCTSCAEGGARVVPSSTDVEPSAEDLRRLQTVWAENHEALATPRQLTRFLCGLSSPATTRAKLKHHEAWGTLARVPFTRVLEWVAQHLRKPG